MINNTYNAAIKATPSKVLLGYDQRNHTDAAITDVIKLLTQIDEDIITEREVSRDAAVIATQQLRKFNKLMYDSKHKKPTIYKEGEFVLVRDSQNKIGESRKLKPIYKSPYMIAKLLNKNRYVVKDVPGFNVTARPYDTILSPDRIKPWIKPIVKD